MKKQIMIIAGLAFFAACTNNTENATDENTDTTSVEVTDTLSAKGEEVADSNKVVFGEEVSEEGAISLEGFAQNMQGKDSVEAKIIATPTKVCQKMGCWFIVELPNGDEMRIKTNDHAYTVPKDMAGKEVVFEGLAYRDTVSVAQLQHYAEDAGKSEEEIAKITEPETSISFRADGVRIL